MLKIGELSKVCNVSVQTLRYYDRIGILCADYVEESTGYRYYHPEKVKIYQQIEQLKQLDFSLDEIRAFLDVPQTEQCRMYQSKKEEIWDSIGKKREIIKKIDRLCENPKARYLPLSSQILNIEFENDARVIGKWEYCGNLTPSEEFSGTEQLTQLEVSQKELFFLPGGGHVWMYFWTKGIVYYGLHEFNVIVPNHYRIFSFQGETYMKIEWMVDSFFNTKPNDTVRIYRQVDRHAYSERETYAYRDPVDLAYSADERVIGEWETVDVIDNLSEFSVDSKRWKKTPFWIVGLKFFERGLCYKTYNTNGNRYDKGFKYTAGILLDEQPERAEHYYLRTEQDVDFLILEHKSADYSYLGKVFCYYVFRRKKQ
ncbi:MAG: MerR family transcriptional regulator [Clostridia bacterium]|nr:MerR family transcriptional regulator [Clostridia bacterium]